ncbi:MAG: HAD-IA family hydrolase [Acidobacteriota bacterium]
MTPSERSYKSIVFDLDGTLVDSYLALTRAINRARGEFGIDELSGEQIRLMVGEGVEILLERAFAPHPLPDGARDLFENTYDEICCEESRILDDVERTLAILTDRGFPMAVCTNKPTGFSVKILRHLNLAGHFRAVVGPDLAGTRKPDGAHLLHALSFLGAGPDEALYVGDMVLDVLAARNAGMDVAVVATGSCSASELVSADPDYFLGRFSDVLDVLHASEPERGPHGDWPA